MRKMLLPGTSGKPERAAEPGHSNRRRARLAPFWVGARATLVSNTNPRDPNVSKQDLSAFGPSSRAAALARRPLRAAPVAPSAPLAPALPKRRLPRASRNDLDPGERTTGRAADLAVGDHAWRSGDGAW